MEKLKSQRKLHDFRSPMKMKMDLGLGSIFVPNGGYKGIPAEIPWDYIESLSGKGSVIYNAHPYHTKLSFEICSKIIRQLSQPNDTILDLFCGSGIVGVAAISEGRNAVLNDLSPYAAHIAKGITCRIESSRFQDSIKLCLDKTREVVKELVGTKNKEGDYKEFSYLIWSDYVSCPECNSWFLLWDAAIKPNGAVAEEFECPSCSAKMNKKKLKRKNGQPVEVVYWSDNQIGQERKIPDKDDIKQALGPCEPTKESIWRPPNSMLNIDPGSPWGEQWRNGYHKHVTHVSDFFSPRTWIILGYMWKKINEEKSDDIRHLLRLAFTGMLVNVSRMIRYIPSRGGRSNTPGTLYCPALWLEQNPLLVFERRAGRIKKLLEQTKYLHNNVRVHTGSASNLDFLQDSSIDLIVTDPPFGANIQYAELNFIPESWLGTFTDKKLEAVENPFRKQTKTHYIDLMRRSLQEAYRVLKPERYAAVFFNSTDVKLWTELRKAMLSCGFHIIKVVPALKGHAGWNQVRHEKTVTGWDPIIFLWKPCGQVPLIKDLDKNAIKPSDFILSLVRQQEDNHKYHYQLWYSAYVSAWFVGQVSGDLLSIKELIGIAKSYEIGNV